MRQLVIGLWVVMWAAATPAAELVSAARLKTFTTQARVMVGKDGSVIDVQADQALPKEVADSVAGAMAGWRFAPPLKDGVAVTGLTFVRLAGCAVEAEGPMRVAWSYLGHGPGRKGPASPRFPPEMMIQRADANLQVDYSVSPDGAASIADIRMIEGRKKYLPLLRQSVTAWIEGNRFEAEQLNGVGVDTRVSVPVRFRSGPSFNSMAAARKQQEKEAQARAAESSSCGMLLSAGKQADREVTLDSPLQLLPQG